MNFSDGNVQVRNIHRRLRFLRNVVGEQPRVAVFPAEHIMDNEDSCVLARAGHVRLIAGGWERDSLAFRFSFPFEAFKAAGGEGHFGHCLL